ncbi:MAG: hypothetical protein NTX58_12495 [Actinobacteria bacterium]|nr:hypothetical protein [Actinomycetota bacterium]
MNRLPPRMILALGFTLVALLLLAVGALRSDPDSKEQDQSQTASENSSTSISTTTALAPEQSTTTTSIKLLPDWYPKGSSRYSDRAPAVTVTTLPPTTTTTTKKSSTTSSVGRSNSSVAGN